MRIILTIIAICLTQLVFAQSKQMEKADELFYSFNYKDAISLYQKELKKGKHRYYCCKMIAKAYSKLNNHSKSIEWYKECLTYVEIESKIYLQLANQLLKAGELNEASTYFLKYYNATNTPHQLTTSSYTEYYNGLLTDSTRYTIINSAINSKYDEFGPALMGDKLVFTSNRPTESPTKRSDIQTGKSFFNIYTFNKKKGQVTLFSKELQSKFNDGPVCFSKDNTNIYITRNTNNDNKSLNTLDIFVSKITGAIWSKNVKRLPIRKGNYSVAHATFNADNTRMYFSSNMPGGFGGMDIYVCEFKNGFLSHAVNLGPKINSSGNEIFPFVDSNDILYFSSDMHPGMGGYDLFFSKKIKDQYSIPFNMGYPVNTPADDFSLVLDQQNKKGYFASNRQGYTGGDDIFELTIERPLAYCMIEAQVYDNADSTLLSQTFVSITDTETKHKSLVRTNKNGKFYYYLKKDKKYFFEVKHDLYADFKGVLSPKDLKSHEVLKLNIGLKEK